MTKYVIKNCPACYKYLNKYGCEDNHDSKGRDTYCQKIDDCLLKQLIAMCENACNKAVLCDALDIAAVPVRDIFNLLDTEVIKEDEGKD